MHFAANSTRFSDDIDFFHDWEMRVASRLRQTTLPRAGYVVGIEVSLPGFVRGWCVEGSMRREWTGRATRRGENGVGNGARNGAVAP